VGPSKKMIWSSASLLFTVSLIFVGYGVFERSIDAATALGKNQENTIQDLEEYPIMKFDGYEISGSVAINLIKEVIGNYDDIDVTVKTTEVPSGFTITDSTHYADFRDQSSSYYINPIVLYQVTVERDGNDVITSVLIEYVGS